ncbi:hypothetical protein [Planktotalea sp.]|uniref:hypothetical protein n=1 Tax=Planktotalea sp. TaxID=2029877 RepID=UPI003299D49D
MSLLNPLILPENGPKRRHIVPDKYRLDGYNDTYDFHTLAYDVIWIARKKAVLLVCPKLLNLESLLTSSKIKISGEGAGKPKIKRYRRHDEVWLSCSQEPSELEIETEVFTLKTKISRQSTDFDNKNVLMTKSKDNDLGWITDWLKHHVENQGANATLIFDNGSNAYSISKLQQSLQSVTGLDTAQAIASDFPFGSWKASKLIHRSMFYQAGMLAIARHRFLHSARAVLPIDIDELITGANVFDAAVHSKIGYVTMPGFWRYSKLPEDQMPRHADHIWRRDPDAGSKEKYCLAPNRWFTNAVWDIHGLHRYAFNKWAMMKDARFLHCEHISTGWKRKRDAEAGHTLVRDTQTEAELKALR